MIAERGIKTYVTIEPIMDFDLDELVSLVKMCTPEQVNIGANSVRSIKIPEPTKGNILIDLIQHLLCFTQVKVKKNLDGDKLTRMLIRMMETRLTLSPIIQSKAYWLCRQSDTPLGQSAYP